MRFVIEDREDDWEDYPVVLDTKTGKEYPGGGGEPEDNSIYRDWNWVIGLLNELSEGD